MSLRRNGLFVVPVGVNVPNNVLPGNGQFGNAVTGAAWFARVVTPQALISCRMAVAPTLLSENTLVWLRA